MRQARQDRGRERRDAENLLVRQRDLGALGAGERNIHAGDGGFTIAAIGRIVGQRPSDRARRTTAAAQADFAASRAANLGHRTAE